MNKKAKKLTAIALGIGAIALVGTVLAGSNKSGTGTTDPYYAQKGYPAAIEQGASDPYLTDQEVVRALESQGYTDIKKIELEKGEYEVKARDADGRRVELYVDPRTGEVLNSKYKE